MKSHMYGSASLVAGKPAATAALLPTLLHGVAACGDSSSGASPDKPPVEVKFSHAYFAPTAQLVSEADTVIFRNIEAMSHPLVNDELGLDTSEFTKGAHIFTFDQAGSFTIANTAHGTSITVVVQGDGS